MSFIAHLKDEAKQNFIQHKMKLHITQQQHRCDLYCTNCECTAWTPLGPQAKPVITATKRWLDILKLMVILTVKDISILGDRIPKILIWELPFGKMIGGILLKSNSMPD